MSQETDDDKPIDFSQIFQRMGESLVPMMEKFGDFH